MNYQAKIDGGMGGEITLEADGMDEAIEAAKEWAHRGAWRKPGVPMFPLSG